MAGFESFGQWRSYLMLLVVAFGGDRDAPNDIRAMFLDKFLAFRDRFGIEG